MHIPTSTTIYIDAAGTEENRTIMRAELVAIHTALSTLSTHNWLGIFTDSLSSLQANRHHHTNPGTTIAKHYHRHRHLLESIADLLVTRQRSRFKTTLHKIRAHTNIRGNYLADAAAKLADTHYDTLPQPQKTTGRDRGDSPPSTLLGHVHGQTSAAGTRLILWRHLCQPPPPMVDHPRGGATANTCVHASLPPT